jgi:hypothetical protein
MDSQNLKFRDGGYVTPSENFDWVSARAECSLKRMFAQLSLDVQSDVLIREEFSKKNLDGRTFVFQDAARGFLVNRRFQHQDTYITFLLNGDSIEISGDGVNFKATLTLNGEGACRFSVAGQELESWQFRRMALEALFFGK